VRGYPSSKHVCSTARLTARPHALRPCACQPRGCHFKSGHLCPPRSTGLAARQRPPGPLKLGCPPPLHAEYRSQTGIQQKLNFVSVRTIKERSSSSDCTGTSCSSTTAPNSWQWHSRRCRPMPAAALLPTRAHTRSLTQAPRTTATASSFYRNSTAFIWHSCGVRCPPRRLPTLRTSSPSISRSPSSLPSNVSRSSSPRIGRPSRSCVSTMPARASRKIASFTSLRSTRPQSRTPPCAWR
jgi:hypothetical protein